MRKNIKNRAVPIFLLLAGCAAFFVAWLFFETVNGTEYRVSGRPIVSADTLVPVENDHPLNTDEVRSFLFQEFVVKEEDYATCMFAGDVNISDVLISLKYIDKEDFSYDLQVYWSMTNGYQLTCQGNGVYTVYPVWVYKADDADRVVHAAADTIGMTGDHLTDFLKIRDYVTSTYHYDYSMQQEDFVTTTDNHMTCVGYSTLFYLLCDRYGIPCRIVNNDVHEWVEVAYLPYSDGVYLEYEPQGDSLWSVYVDRAKAFWGKDSGRYKREVA